MVSPTSSVYTDLHRRVASAICPPAGSKAVHAQHQTSPPPGSLPSSSLFIPHASHRHWVRPVNWGPRAQWSPGRPRPARCLAQREPASCLLDERPFPLTSHTSLPRTCVWKILQVIPVVSSLLSFPACLPRLISHLARVCHYTHDDSQDLCALEPADLSQAPTKTEHGQFHSLGVW